MIRAIVMGMHKSGTTLVAKTLHDAGIDMNPEHTGEYPKAKYEDVDFSRMIKKNLYGKIHRHSLEIPSLPIKPLPADEIQKYFDSREKKSSFGWGVKFPDIVFCYDDLKKYIPPHIAIGVVRSESGVLNHYNKTKRNHDLNHVKNVRAVYNAHMLRYNIPIVSYELLLAEGPKQLENIIGIDLPDCRRNKWANDRK